MAVNHLLSLSQDKFELFVSNVEIEDNLADSDSSSAAHFTTHISLDLEPMLFLRSASAKLSLSYLTIDTLALAFTSSESISISFLSPKEILSSNLIFSDETITTTNNKLFMLQFTDFTAPTITAPIEYMNKLISSHMNLFIAYRLSLTFFDKNLFIDDLFSHGSLLSPITLSDDEICLLLRYIDITAFMRQVLAITLPGEVGKDPPPFTFSNLTPVFSSDLEKTTLANSKTLKSLADRKTTEATTFFHLVDFSSFHDVNLSVKGKPRKDLIERMKTHIRSVIEFGYGVPLAVPLTDLSTADKTLVNNIKLSNLAMLAEGETLRRILLVQRSKIAASSVPPPFISTEFLSLSLDDGGTKAKFVINNQHFLPPDETQISLSLPKKAAYTLGCSPLQEHIQIGPISHDSDTISNRLPHFSNSILSSAQRLLCSIRHHPKLVRVLTDVLSPSENKNLWPTSDEFAAFQTIFCIHIDESTFQQRFIHKTSTDVDFHKMLRSENSLQKFSLLFCDENGRMLSFPRNTYVFVTIRLEPVSSHE